MPTSVRLDRKTEKLVERLGRAQSRTKSEVILLAAEKELGTGKDESTRYERSAHLIGCVSGGPRDLSGSTGAKVRKILGGKARSRWFSSMPGPWWRSFIGATIFTSPAPRSSA